MARPWPKRSAWPYVCKNGRKSYTVGFYDHDKRERSRSFPSLRHARAWMDDYVTAGRRGRDSLRRFLLDLDGERGQRSRSAHDRAADRALLRDGRPPTQPGRLGAQELPPIPVGRRAAHPRERNPNSGGQAQATASPRAGGRERSRGALQRATGTAGLARSDDAGRRAPIDTPSCVGRHVSRPDLGGTLASHARDPEQRLLACQRAHDQSTTLSPPRRRDRLRPRNSSPATRALGALSARRRGDPRADAAPHSTT